MKMRSALALALLVGSTAAQASLLRFYVAFEPEGGGGRSGTGSADVTFDDVSHVLSFAGSFAGLSGSTTQAHFHCCTALPGTGNAIIAVDTPSLFGFPIGVKSGTFDSSLDLNLAANFNPAFITASGGTTDLAIERFINGAFSHTAYLNIHTGAFPGGEIRGFLVVPEPAGLALFGLGLLGLVASRRKRAA